VNERKAVSIKTILLDIEGTTTRVEFVTDVLFPYARRRVEPFLREHSSDPDVRADLEELKREHAQDVKQGLSPPAVAEVTCYVHWLMDRDRKSTSLKSLQGKIWEAGYRAGELRGEVYDDVPRAIERWRWQDREMAIFSSGSVLAQKLLFSSTRAGDLTQFICGYFDTTTGPKREAESYRRIAQAVGAEPAAMIFISDTVPEADAARAAGVETLLCVRGARSPSEPHGHAVIHSFDEVFP
jgi:enolase-phosphatase E1